MITSQQLAPNRYSGDDCDPTERLKAEFGQARKERRPMYLTMDEFDRILHWKLRQQYGRQKARRAANSEQVVRAITETALNIAHPDPDYEVELRLGVLCALRGVDVPVASAVLALVFPEKYAVVDFRNWRQVFDQERDVFSVPDYKRYLCRIRVLAEELGWLPQEVDLAIWVLLQKEEILYRGVHLSLAGGLEQPLIARFYPPWNMRG